VPKEREKEREGKPFKLTGIMATLRDGRTMLRESIGRSLGWEETLGAEKDVGRRRDCGLRGECVRIGV
jgi:hypothetical protein